jgi:hypothetical protein
VVWRFPSMDLQGCSNFRERRCPRSTVLAGVVLAMLLLGLLVLATWIQRNGCC